MRENRESGPDPLGDLRGRLLRRAQRLMGSHAQADDLVQDALVAAWVAGRDCNDSSTERWLAGVLWRRAAFLRRTGARRRRRERAYLESYPVQAWPSPPVRSATPPPALPPSLQIVARLAEGGCSRTEIAWLLGIRPEALRQRIAALRRHLRGTEPPPERAHPTAPGPVRRAVLPLAQQTGTLGSHDPDGYPILVGCSRTEACRQP